uniref:ATP synthase F0 subunit 8 n=1 Tax=Austrarchaea milledgei TaxID=1028701 RepID=H2E465_9ARAC|nr:ATP synthase F0 subunit 8 [Austrarchaea milledgei]
MPQLSPLYWMISSLMVLFLLMSMMVVFFMNSVDSSSVESCNVCLMNWYW